MLLMMSKARKQENDVLENLIRQKAEISQKLREINAIGSELTAVVDATNTTTTGLVSRINKELKVARKAITSIFKMLDEGVIVLNSSGEITQVNRQAENLFEFNERTCLMKQFHQLFKEVKNSGTGISFNTSQKLFEKISKQVFETLSAEDTSQGSTKQDRVKAVLPAFLELDREIQIEVTMRDDRKFTLHLSFSLLDNDPEDVKDVTYIFMFRVVPMESLAKQSARQSHVTQAA